MLLPGVGSGYNLSGDLRKRGHEFDCPMIVKNETSVERPTPARPANQAPAPEAAGLPPAKAQFDLPFDPLRLVAAILRKWYWLVLGGALLAALGGSLGYLKFEAQYTATAQLMRQETAGTFRASELGEPFKPRQLSVPTLVSLMKSPAVLQGVSEQTKPRLSQQAILGGVTITPERNTDLITVDFKSTRSAALAVRVLNLFGAEVVRMTRELQAQEAIEVNRLLKQELAKTDEELHKMNEELLAFAKESGVVSVDKEMDAYLSKLGNLDLRYEATRIDYETLDMKIHSLEKELSEHNPLRERVQVASDRLAEMRAQLTDTNPALEDQKDRVAELEKQLREAPNQSIAAPRPGDSGLAVSFYQELVSLRTQKEVFAAQLEKLKTVRVDLEEKLRGLPEKGMQYARIKAKQQSLETAQSLLASRQREAQIYEDNPPGYYRFFEAKPEDIQVVTRAKKLILVTVAGGVLGVMFSLVVVCLVESLDDRIKTVADAGRATKLPLLATLPELGAQGAAEPGGWAFRVWMALRARLDHGANQSVICGFVASSRGEGVSTWIELLARAASLREATALAVTNRAPGGGATFRLAEALLNPAGLPLKPGSVTWLLMAEDWRWDATRRSLWQTACEQWQRANGLVLLVELKDADQPETLLMAEALPQLIWVAAGGQSRAQLTTQRLQVLRDAHCRFAGLVLNREKKLFPWSKADR